MQIAVAFRSSLSLKRTLKAAALAMLFGITSWPLLGQAVPTAQKTGDLSVFALYTRLTPDYGPTSNNGLTFGVSYLRYTRWWVNPAVEFRAKIANGATVDEKTIGGGIRLESSSRNITPTPIFLSVPVRSIFTCPALRYCRMGSPISRMEQPSMPLAAASTTT